MVLLAGERCWIKGRKNICLTFGRKEGGYLGAVVIHMPRLSDLKALKRNKCRKQRSDAAMMRAPLE